jgi:hypothetical protein
MVVRRFSRMGSDMLLKFSKKCAKKNIKYNQPTISIERGLGFRVDMKWD